MEEREGILSSLVSSRMVDSVFGHSDDRFGDVMDLGLGWVVSLT